MHLDSKIKELLIPYLADEKIFVVDVRVSASRVLTKVLILLDSDAGITIDECAEISRQLGHDLEEQNVMPNAYNLEISSPGVDTPLKFLRQYPKNIGRSLKVILKDGTEVNGKLEQVNTENAVISLSKSSTKKPKKGEVPEMIELPFDQIKEAIVQISFK